MSRDGEHRPSVFRDAKRMKMNARATSSKLPKRSLSTRLASLKLLCQLGAVAAIGFAAGCATQTKVDNTEYFFPPPPDAPRLQYLTSFGSEKEFHGGEEKTMMNYLTGSKPAEKILSKPYGAAVGNKKIYICDTELGAVVVGDFATRHFGVIDAQGEGALKMPLNLTVDSDGSCYVADAGREQVVVFDKNGHYVSTIGKQDELKPRDVAVTADRIYIADLQKHRVCVLDKATHNVLFDIPRSEDQTNKARALFTPTNLGVDSKGNVYVSDTGAFHVQVYDPSGKFLGSVGEMGDGPGQFARVKGIALDRENRLYAADAMSQVVQIFNDEGKPLTWFGEPGADKQLQNLPAKVLVDYEDVPFFEHYASPKFKVEHLVFVINQIGPHKVSVYGFGHVK
jgi:DNA-binding beta-propeller fold protein YncE